MSKLKDMDDPGSQSKVLLLLSGGKDSRQCISVLQSRGYRVLALCISGKQGLEESGAKRSAGEFGLELVVYKSRFFDELTWNPMKLISRDILMGIVAIKTCQRLGIRQLATGVKDEDLQHEQLWWLRIFLNLGRQALGLFHIRLIFPLIDDEVLPSL
ncbi:MAG: hypothetical protein IT288_08125 [Bdellovibrionales bacterium]|nr:hypothetical protein [Bdellovibrionales bacterium]